MMRKFNQAYRLLLYFNLFVNAVFCTLCPPVLLALLGKYLCSRFLWHRAVIAVFVLIGTGIGIYSCASYIRKSGFLTGKGDSSEANNPYRIDKHRQSDDH